MVMPHPVVIGISAVVILGLYILSFAKDFRKAKGKDRRRLIVIYVCLAIVTGGILRAGELVNASGWLEAHPSFLSGREAPPPTPNVTELPKEWESKVNGWNGQ